MNKKGYIHHRRSIRLKGYDYSPTGFYFVTICTHNQKCYFGEIKDERMILNRFGKIAKLSWFEIENHFPNIELDYQIIMPNHIHGIIVIHSQCRGLINQTPTSWILMKNPDINLGKIVRYFKARTTRLLRNAGLKDFGWQRGYYEHVIRNEKSLHHIRQYIINNPIKCQLDRENQKNRQKKINMDVLI